MTHLYLGTENGVHLIEQSEGGWQSRLLGLEGKRVQALAPAGDELLVAVRHDGVHRIADGAIERTLEGDPWSLAAAGGLAFAGLEPAGVARSTEGGRAWAELPSFREVPGAKEWWFPAAPHVAHVRSIVLDRSDPDTVFAGIEVGGVLVSEDGGEHWQERFGGLYEDVHTLTQSPSEPQILYAATGRGFYRSFDRSRSWAYAMEGMDRSYTVTLAALPNHPDLLVMSAAQRPPGIEAALYRSDDGGASWEPLGARHGLPDRFERVAQLAQAGEACFAATAEGELYRSSDGGGRWERLLTGLPAATTLVAGT